MKKILSILALLVFAISIQAQTLAMYVEYGGKGIKLGVLSYSDKSFHKYKPIDSKELNVGLSKAIQTTGNISQDDINAAVSSSNDAYQALLAKYKDKGLEDKNVFFYTSSGLGVAKNVQDLCSAIKAKTGHGVYVVGDVEEAKYTIAGTIPYEKIDNALVLDQGGSNTKGGYIVADGNSLTAIPVTFDLGSVRLTHLITTKFMTTHPDDKAEELKEYIIAMNKCFDSIKPAIKNTFSNIDGAESRTELYLSGGAAFCVSTLMYPDADLTGQMVPLKLNDLKAFLNDIQDRDYYKKLQTKTFAETDEAHAKAYKGALKVYNQLQLMSATKLLLSYINALSGDDKQIYFNRYGLHSMPSILMGRAMRGDIKRW